MPRRKPTPHDYDSSALLETHTPSPDEAQPAMAPASGVAGSLRAARRRAAAAFEREYVTQLLTESGGNITRAAVLAGVSRQMIQKLARKYGL